METRAKNAMSDAAAKYRLNRDVLASSRLNYQHYIWKETLGFLLHPNIDILKADLRIADIGTGTAFVYIMLLGRFGSNQPSVSGSMICLAISPTSRYMASTFRVTNIQPRGF